MPDDDEFSRQSIELAETILTTMMGYPDIVVIGTLPAMMACLAHSFGIPRPVVIEMFDCALEDLQQREKDLRQ